MTLLSVAMYTYSIMFMLFPICIHMLMQKSSHSSTTCSTLETEHSISWRQIPQCKSHLLLCTIKRHQSRPSTFCCQTCNRDNRISELNAFVQSYKEELAKERKMNLKLTVLRRRTTNVESKNVCTITNQRLNPLKTWKMLKLKNCSKKVTSSSTKLTTFSANWRKWWKTKQ